VPANPWELRADVRPLELAALRWSEIGSLLARRGDEIVDAARRATDGWDAAAAESYENHRRQVLANLDRFTSLAGQISGSLRAISSIITSSQKELDQAWVNVAMVPHDVVGESRYLVFRPTEDEDRGKVTRGQAEADEIRRRLTLSLDQESTRLRSARAEFSTVRTELKALSGGAFPFRLGPGGEESGVGTVPPASTSVRGSAQSGVAGLPPIAPISVSMPDLTGLSTAGLTPFVATAASGLAGRRAGRSTTNGVPPIGGMGAGAMGVRAGTTSRGMASGRTGPHRLATPTLRGATDDEAARLAREKEAAKQAEKDAKRAALAEKRAERAARRAERQSERREDETPEPTPAEDMDDDLDDGLDAADRSGPDLEGETDAEDPARRR
jgi:hypothetical protein